MSNILVFCERDDVAFEILSASSIVSGTTFAAVLGKNAEERAQTYSLYGATKILVSDHPTLNNFDAEVYADTLARIIEKNDIDIIFCGSTRRGRELAPRLAQRLSGSCITDVSGFNESLIFWRYTLGGTTQEKLKPTREKMVIAFLPKAFDKIERKVLSDITQISFEPSVPRTKIIERQKKSLGQANIEDAERIVGVGRGIVKKEDLVLIEELARFIGAEIGCTRPLAADFGWLTEDRIIGLSGKKSKPKFYLALGVSGQIQHTVGIRDAKVIAAIDKNKDAPIFRMADYGIVGDLYEYVPLILKRLKGG